MCILATESCSGSDSWRQEIKKMSKRCDLKNRRVGKYEVGRTIGEGSSAKVKLARDVETGDFVALKIIDKEKALKHNITSLIEKEITTMKLVNHPNVIRVHEVLASRTKIFIVLEYASGGDLFDKIANGGRLKEDEGRRLFQQLIRAVDYIHSRGVCHRDLKLENVLLDGSSNLKVSDFGFSAVSPQDNDDGMFHTACGSPNYVAPEILDQKGYDGATADVWSCGVILFAMLAGYLPFEDSNLINLYKSICAAKFILPPWVSFDAMTLIVKLLDPNPRTRITVDKILEDTWFKKGFNKTLKSDEKCLLSQGNVEDLFRNLEGDRVSITEEEDSKQPEQMTAFGLISMSRGLNLDNLLLQVRQELKRETRFMSKCPADEIVERIEQAVKPLGFDVFKCNFKMRLEDRNAGRKGRLSIATEVFRVAPNLHLVEMRKTKGDTAEFHKLQKSLVASALGEVVWKTEEDLQGEKGHQ
uniref:non-specific serine/threonine protein kinase n=1 Tax=Kalanchoe fedtschenkoi TaxID=63787 RepID=A0A7N0UUQ6_KALFE